MNNCAPAVELDASVQDIQNGLTTLDKAIDALNNTVNYCTTSLGNFSQSLDEILSDLAGKAADWLPIISKAGDQLVEEAEKAVERLKSSESVDSAQIENHIEQSPEDNGNEK